MCQIGRWAEDMWDMTPLVVAHCWQATAPSYPFMHWASCTKGKDVVGIEPADEQLLNVGFKFLVGVSGCCWMKGEAGPWVR